MNIIREYLKENNHSVAADTWDTNIAMWDALYKGFLKEFHEYNQYNGKKYVKRKRSSLGMANKICQDHASLLLNEKCEIETSNKEFNTKLKAVLASNNFKIRANQLVEVSFALGTGAFVEYEDENKNVIIDYIRAQMIYPISWDNGEIVECAFGSMRRIEGEDVYYVNIHKKDASGNYVIENKFFKNNEEREDVVVSNINPMVTTGSPIPRFQIITPNMVNNIEYDCPMGISVFANAIDILKGIDLIFDSYVCEFKLGRKRIIIPQNMIQLSVNADNVYTPTFDDNDIEFYAVDNEVSSKIEETGGDIRHEAHEAALNKMLSILSDACMLGTERYSFSKSIVRTATEVINEQSDMFRGIKKNELVIETALIGLVKSIASMTGIETEKLDIKVNFDDSIIEDTAAKRTRMQMFAIAGKFPMWRYLKEYEGYEETVAREIANEIKKDEIVIDFAKGADGE